MKKISIATCLAMLLGSILACSKEAVTELIDADENVVETRNSLLENSNVLWQIGQRDNSSTEFAARNLNSQLILEVPADWANRENWNDFPGRLGADTENEEVVSVTFKYKLASVPENGVLLKFKLLDGTKSVPELAVHSNSLLAGLIQLWGTQGIRSASGSSFQYQWQKSYQLYIPKELLLLGDNELRLSIVRNGLSKKDIDKHLRAHFDYFELSILKSPTAEPIHGKITHMGTSMRLGMDSFSIDRKTLATTPPALKWMGIAYSNNTMRAEFWSDLSPTAVQPRRLEYLKLLKQYNMSVVANHLNSEQVENCGVEAGQLCSQDRQALVNFFERYGDFIQWMEIDNEPGLFERTLRSNIAIANGINALKPSHVKTAAPGWAFAQWARDREKRSQIEALSETLNGHAYGKSYNDYSGGSFVENLRTYEGVTDGWPKEYITTEMGTNKHHSENASESFQPHAAMFDRIIRAHIAVADRFMHHAFAFGHYGMFKKGQSWFNYETLQAYPGVNGEETRLKTWRRYALAYATHGKPLTFSYTDPKKVENQLVYFRAVDTSALAPQPGSQATSNKLLLNFVNFSNKRQVMQVQVELPGCGTIKAERFGAGDVYSEAYSEVTLQPNPYIELEETLEPGEAVQYITEPPRSCTQ